MPASRAIVPLVLLGLNILAARPATAFLIELEASDFSTRTNVFSEVRGFSIAIEVLGPLRTGAFADPALGDIEFLVAGDLDPTTPARTANPNFRSFAVDDRPGLSGQDFYDQGNSLTFEVAAGADLSDGLQLSELVGSGLVFEFDGRELGTGRYHPPILQLFADRTGSIRNANNTGGINPFTMVEVDVDVGDEYITTLAFPDTDLTLVVPEPGSALLVGLGLAALGRRRQRGTR
jgi:hypothetical protein